MATSPASSVTFDPSQLVALADWYFQEAEDGKSKEQGSNQSADPSLTHTVQRSLSERQAQSGYEHADFVKGQALCSTELTSIVDEVLMSSKLRRMISLRVNEAVREQLEVIIPVIGNMNREFESRFARLENAVNTMKESLASSGVATLQAHLVLTAKNTPRTHPKSSHATLEASAEPVTAETRHFPDMRGQQQSCRNISVIPTTSEDVQPLHAGHRRQRPQSGRSVVRSTAENMEESTSESLLSHATPGTHSALPQRLPMPQRPPSTSGRHRRARSGPVPAAELTGSSTSTVSVLPGGSQGSGMGSGSGMGGAGRDIMDDTGMEITNPREKKSFRFRGLLARRGFGTSNV